MMAAVFGVKKEIPVTLRKITITYPILLASFVCITANSAFCQSKETVPIPEYYGTYAVVEGKLVKLDSSQVQVATSQVPLGQRATVGNVLQGQSVATSNTANAARFTPDLKIVVFSQPSGLQSPLDVAKQLHVKSLVFARNVTVHTGWPSNVTRSGTENGWESGDAPELAGLAEGDRPKRFDFLVKPMPGHPEMVVAVLPEQLRPGAYKLVFQEEAFGFEPRWLLFAVEPVSDGERSKCVDALITYSMSISSTKYTPCGEALGSTPSRPGTSAGASTTSSSGNELVGVYVNDRNGVEHLDLGSDSKFSWKVGDRDFTGSYQLSEGILTLTFHPVGATARGKLAGGRFNCCLSNGLGPVETKLIDDENRNWVRQVPTHATSSACSQAVDASYSILLQGHLYKVKTIGPGGPRQIHLFFDEKGAQVTDSNSLQQLSVAAWTRDNVVALEDARNGTHRLSGILGTSKAIQEYSAIQDALARGMVEALESVVTDGVSLSKALPHLTVGILSSQLKNAPMTIFTLLAQRGLEQSLSVYQQIEAVPLPPADASVLNAPDLIKIRNLYGQARTLELPYEALAAKLMPTSASQLTNQAFASALSELIPSIGLNSTETVTLQRLLDLQKSISNLGDTLPALQAFSQNLNLALALADANRRQIAQWAAAATQTCN